MTQRHGRSRGIFVAGGAALIALGIWMGGLFNGLGPGGGAGSGDGKSEKKVTDKDDAKPSDDPKIVDPDNGTSDAGPLHVVLEPNGYAIAAEKDGRTGYSSATIREIVADAIATREQPDGYRVVITSRAGVSAGAHQDLVRQLEEAGLEPDEILGYDSKDVAAEE